MVFPETYINFYQRNGGLIGGRGLGGLSKTWKSPEPLEGITHMFKARRMTGVVVDSNDKPVAGAVVHADFCEPQQKTLTNEEGRFELDVFPYEPRESLCAFKPGVGAGMISPDFPLEDVWKVRGDKIHWEQWREKHSDGPFTIKIEGGKPITVKVVDPEGNPLEGILTYPSHLYAENSSWNTGDFGGVFPQYTDKNGMATFDWMPMQSYHIISFTAKGTDPRFDKESKNNQYGKSEVHWRESANNNDLVIQLPRKIMIECSAIKADGTPPAVPGMQVHVTATTGWQTVGVITGYGGNFTFFVNANEVLSVQPIWNQGRDPNTGVTKAQLNVPIGNGNPPPPRFDFILEEGTVVKGKIISKTPMEDYSSLYISVYDDAAGDGQLTEMNRIFTSFDLTKEGDFESRFPDGRFLFTVSGIKDGEKSIKKEIEKPLIINGETEIRFDLEI